MVYYDRGCGGPGAPGTLGLRMGRHAPRSHTFTHTHLGAITGLFMGGARKLLENHTDNLSEVSRSSQFAANY